MHKVSTQRRLLCDSGPGAVMRTAKGRIGRFEKLATHYLAKQGKRGTQHSMFCLARRVIDACWSDRVQLLQQLCLGAQ